MSGDIGVAGDNSDNSYHVVVGSSTDSSAILDGFTVTSGNADNAPDDDKGGGMYNHNGSPTVANVIFRENSATYGGGMFNGGETGFPESGSHPTLTNVVFDGNSATEGGGMENMSYSSPNLTDVTFKNQIAIRSGGGILNMEHSSPVLVDVTFRNNEAGVGGGMATILGDPNLTAVTFSGNSAEWGGGMANGYSNPTITNVTFTGNSATTHGGGISNEYSNPILTNVTISGNSALTYGGGISNDADSHPSLRNVTISGNTADSYGGLYNQGNASIRSSILYGNSGDEIYGTADVTYSVVEGGYAGTGNLDLDPQLGSLQDNSGPTFTMALGDGSPAIDAGEDADCPDTDQRGMARPQGSHCDIGAFEYRHVLHYVDQDATGANNGTSWTNAFIGLRSALSASLYGDEIWAAAGTYYPTSGTDRTISFVLQNGVAMYGGFSGTETARDQRDVEANVTTLSGDIGTSGDPSDNSYHVVIGGILNESGTYESNVTVLTDSTILDGFTITAGNANGLLSYDQNDGGGIFNVQSHLMIANVIFTGNSSAANGGGMFNLQGHPTFVNVTFKNNSAVSSGGGFYNTFGGAMADMGTLNLTNVAFTGNSAGAGGGIFSQASNFVLTNAIISGNSAASGAGIYNAGADSVLANVTINGNTATTNGGGIYYLQSNPTLTNVTISGNTASTSGGGMYNLQSNPALTNATISGNSANSGAGIYNLQSNPTITNVTINGNTAATDGGGVYNSQSNPVLTNVTLSANSAGTNGGGIYSGSFNGSAIYNTIIWGNSAPNGAQIHILGPHTLVVSDSIVQGGYAGGTNIITADPKLGTLGNYGGYTQTIPLNSGSSAIDRGNASYCPDADQRGVTRPQGPHCDIGAYEYQGPQTRIVTNTNNSGSGSLRQALTDAASGETIMFDPSLAGQTINLLSPVTITDKKVILDGSGLSPQVTIDGGGTAGFNLNLSSSMDIHDLTISNLSSTLRLRMDAVIQNSTLRGFTNDVISSYGSLTITDSVLENNDGQTIEAYGPVIITNSVLQNNADEAVRVSGISELTITDSVVSGNGGDAIRAGGPVTVIDSTVMGNSGVGIEVTNSTLSLVNSTVYQNAEEALTINGNANGNAAATIVNSTIAKNQGSMGQIFSNGLVDIDISNSIIVGTTNRVFFINAGTLNLYNSIVVCTHDNECFLSVAGTVNWFDSSVFPNATWEELGLEEPADNGGPTPTMALSPSSFLIDAGDDTICASSPVNNLDQRGVTRPQGSHCDIGAYEARFRVVTNTHDFGSGSLRQTVEGADSGDTIMFAPSLAGQTITLESNLEIDKDLAIDASDLTNPLSLNLGLSNIRVLNGTVTLSSLTIQNGYSNGDGGAIWSNGNLKLVDTTIRDSQAASNGGGIYSSGTLTIQGSAIYGNRAELNGGGIYADTPGSQVQIINSTISENYAYQQGGAIYSQGETVLSILNATIAGPYSGSISQVVTRGQSEVTLSNSVIACWFRWISPPATYAECYDFMQPPSVTNSILGIKGNGYGLLELADNGGPTKTISLGANSPLVDAGDDAVCASERVDHVDQRGVPRPFGTHCDIGAYEAEYLTISGNAGVGDAVVKYGYGLYTDADTDGNYSIRVLPGWTGTVVPGKLGYSFTPTKLDYTDIQVDQASQDYTATANTYSYPNHPGDTWRVSVSNGGEQTDDEAHDPSISADGRYVAFASAASTLVPEDTDYAWDIFVRDNQTGEINLVSVHSDGVKFESNSSAPVISADGRYVAFVSYEWYDTHVVFVHDRHTGITQGLPFRGPPQSSERPSISADGRYIAYMQDGTLTEGDSNNAYDIFVYDQWSTSLERVSLSSSGAQANGASSFPVISGDGRYVVFQSSATNLVDGDTNGVEDIFVRDLQTGTTRRVSIDSNGNPANSGSFFPSISGDGRYVAFHSAATNLVSNDTNGKEDVFVHDLQTGETRRVSVSSSGVQGNQASNQVRLSANGNYVAFRSYATNLVSGDTNGVADLFVYNLQTGKTRLVSVASNGAQANGDSPSSYSSGFSISEDGRYVAFSSDATNLVPNDTNDYSDIFVHDGLAVQYGLGKYDDMDDGWTYSSGFSIQANTNAHDGGIHYSTAVGTYAEFTFTGSQVTLLYTGNTNRGKVDIYLDGTDAAHKIGTIDQYTSSVTYQKGWTSGNLGEGEHTIRFVHAGAAGKVINIDALIVQTYVALGNGIYDDLHGGWTYSNGFSIQANTNAHDGGIHYSTTVGTYAEFTFTGSQVVLLYTGNTNRGKVDIYLDGTDAAHKLGTLNQYTSSVSYQEVWTSGDLGDGEHTIRFVHAGAAGKVINVDALIVQTYVAPGEGTYDDLHGGWTYSNGFSIQANTNAHDDGIHYSTTVGTYAEFTFTGSQVVLLYTGNTNRGQVDVYLDGTDAAHKLTTLNQYTSSVSYQEVWTSGDLGEGEHTIRFVHAGVAGKVINVDAITVGTYTPPPAVNPEINDDDSPG